MPHIEALHMKRPRIVVALLLVSAVSVLLAAESRQATAHSPGPLDGGLRLLSSDRRGVTLELWTPRYEIRESDSDGQIVQAIHVSGYYNGSQEGEPHLPVQRVLLGVPAQGRIVLEVLAVDEAPPLQGLNLARDGQAGAAIAEITDDAWIRSQRVVRLELRPFQVDEMTPTDRLSARDGSTARDVRHYRYLRVNLRFEGTADAAAPAAAAPGDQAFESVYRGMLLNYESARAWRRLPAPDPRAPSAAAAVAWPQLKLLVTETGIYQVSYDQLVAAGLPVSTLDPRTLRLRHQGLELPIVVTGEADGRFDSTDALYFYGQGLESKYSNVNVYWLSYGESAGQRLARRDATPGEGSTPSSFLTTVRFEEDLLYVYSLPDEEREHWYWQDYQWGSMPRRSFAVSLHGVAPGVHLARLRPSIWGYTADQVDPDHHLTVDINGITIGDAAWDGRTAFDGTLPFGQWLLYEGQNSIEIEAVGDTGSAADAGYIDWLEIEYQHSYRTSGEELAFDGEGSGPLLFEVGGWSSAPALLLDVTDPLAPVWLEGAQAVGMAGDLTLRFSDVVTDESHYRAATERGLSTPLDVVQDTPSALRRPENGADYIIISHPEFLSSVDPLATLRRKQGFRVMVVDVTDVYDEFQHGIVHPDALRDFLSYAYHNWQPPAPAYVLLVGDATYDPLDHLGSGARTFVPTYLSCVDPLICETATDNRFVTVEGEDILPDMHIGRLPVNSAEEAGAVVQKLVDYDRSLPPGEWRREVLFVADNADQAGDFPRLADAVADSLPPPYVAQKVYYGETHLTVADAQQAILDAVNDGALLVSYLGYGGNTMWAQEFLFSTANLPFLTNGARLPVMVPMTSLEGSFQYPQISCLAERVVRLPDGGAIASWSPTGWGVAHGHDYLHQGFYQSLFQQEEPRLGPATVSGKLNLFLADERFHDLIDTYVLIGDPALAVALEGAAPTATPSATPSPILTPTPTPTGIPSATPTHTPTPSRTGTASPTASPSPTQPPTASATRTPTPTQTEGRTPTATPTGSPTATPKPSRSATPTATGSPVRPYRASLPLLFRFHWE